MNAKTAAGNRERQRRLRQKRKEDLSQLQGEALARYPVRVEVSIAKAYGICCHNSRQTPAQTRRSSSNAPLSNTSADIRISLIIQMPTESAFDR